MQQDKLIRERIKVKVYNETGKIVRNVFYLTMDDTKCYYCLVGNNKNIFGVASIDMNNDIEVII